MDRLQKMDRSHGPLQIVHDFQFVALNVHDDYTALDSMCYEEKLRTIKGRIDGLREKFYSGVVLNVDFRNYLQSGEAFRLLSEVVDYARSRDMRVWIYDEQYYPSGAAGGLTLRDHPELEGIGLACVSGDYQVEGAAIRIASPHGYSELKYGIAVPIIGGTPDFSRKVNISDKKDLAGSLCWDAPDGQWRVYAFFVRVLYELTYLPQSLRASRRYPNILDKKAIDRFVDLTFRQGYEKYLGSSLGEKIEAVFTDEPSLMPYSKFRGEPWRTKFRSISVYDKPDTEIPIHPYIPWFAGIPENFRARYGYDLIESLPDLFEETEQAEKVRTDFYQLVSNQVEQAYMGTMCDYLTEQGVAMSGHYNCEEMPARQPQMYGDILAHLGRMDIPGCDRLYSEAEKLRYSVACKMASSAAHIHGKDRVMIEASNMMDKDQNIDLKKITIAISMMFAHGVNEITSYYSERVLPEADMKRFGQYVSRMGSIFEGGKYKIDTLLFYPFEELCAGTTPEGMGERTDLDTIRIGETCENLLSRQICFDIINIQKAEECGFEKGALWTGYGERIRNIVLPEISAVSARTAEFLQKARSGGVKVYFYGKSREIRGLPFVPLFLEESEIQSSDLRLETPDPLISVMHRSFEDCQLYLMVNSEEQNKKLRLSVPYGGGCWQMLEPLDGVRTALEPVRDKERAWLEVSIPERSSVIICRCEA